MKIGKFIKGTVLFGMIALVAGISGLNDKEAAAASANPSSVTVASDVNQASKAGTLTDLYPVSIQTEDGARYGYIDATGKMIIQPVYTFANNFSEGFATVYNNDKYQLINLKGEVIYETEGILNDVHNGLVSYSDPDKNYLQGYINTEGKVAIKPQYNYAGNFKKDHTAIVSKSGKYYMIDDAGKILKTYKVDSKYSYGNVTDDATIIFTDSNTYLQGLVNLQGKVILKPSYGEIVYLGNSLYGVKKPLTKDAYLINTEPSAIFNKKGKKLTDYKYLDLKEFNGDYASVTDSKYTYFINKSGNKVSSLPKVVGWGSMKVLGDVVQVNMNGDLSYLKKDGRLIWENSKTTLLTTGAVVNTVTIRPNKYVVVRYPKLEGMDDAAVQNKINAKLNTIFTANRVKLKETDYLSVDDKFFVKQSKDLLIINRVGYDYPIGAAHGTPFSEYYFINLNRGDFYQLNDLFKKDSDYQNKLAQLIDQQIKNNKEDGMYYFTDDVKISKTQSFNIKDDGITIYFSYGEIAANAAGIPGFEIPFKDISDMINTDGAFWKSFN